MNKSNSIKYNSLETIDKTNLSEQTKIRLDETSKIENYFIEEINQRKSYSKKLNKCVTTFDYIDKNLIVSICLFTSIVGASVGIASASFTLILSLSTGITKKLLNITRKKKKKKHDEILRLAKSKLNSIETISQALTDMDISHEEFITILKEKDR